jgi:translation initiation factor IF-3
LRINNRIRVREVRLIDEQGAQLGIYPLRDALLLAEERGYDLVEVAPNAVPPVCRIMDYGKFRYEQSKKERDARKNQRVVEIKEIRLEPKTGEHDLDVKSRKARKFLLEGDKVKFNLKFRGREIYHSEIGRAVLEQMAETLRDVAVIEQQPLMEGKVLSLLVAPNAKAKAAAAAREKEIEEREAERKRARASAANASADDDDDEDLDDADDDELDDNELDDDDDHDLDDDTDESDAAVDAPGATRK